MAEGKKEDRAKFFAGFFKDFFGVNIWHPASSELLEWARSVSMQATNAAGRAAASGIAQSTLIEYDGAPHGLFATEKSKLTLDLLRFLS